MSGFELPPVAIKNTWKKREGRKGGGERKRFGICSLVFPLTLHNAKNPCSIPSPSTSLWWGLQPHITLHMLALKVSPPLGCPSQELLLLLIFPVLFFPAPWDHTRKRKSGFPLGEDFPGPAAHISSKPGLLPNFERAALTSGREVPPTKP